MLLKVYVAASSTPKRVQARNLYASTQWEDHLFLGAGMLLWAHTQRGNGRQAATYFRQAMLIYKESSELRARCAALAVVLLFDARVTFCCMGVFVYRESSEQRSWYA